MSDDAPQQEPATVGEGQQEQVDDAPQQEQPAPDQQADADASTEPAGETEPAADDAPVENEGEGDLEANEPAGPTLEERVAALEEQEAYILGRLDRHFGGVIWRN